jgi:hypothetical protein
MTTNTQQERHPMTTMPGVNQTYRNRQTGGLVTVLGLAPEGATDNDAVVFHNVQDGRPYRMPLVEFTRRYEPALEKLIVDPLRKALGL